MHELQSLPPEIDDRTRVLVLGTMPGTESLRMQEYYAHRRNRFWRVVQELVGVPVSEPYRERVQRLLSAGIGLWDTLEACQRRGSLDSNIRNAKPNDVGGLLAGHPEVTVIALNGRKAADVFRRRIFPTIVAISDLTVLELPSTSPANARGGLEGLLAQWKALGRFV